MSYGTNTDENFQVIGEYTGRILTGEQLGDLPIQQPTRFEFVINLKTAKVLGLTIPEDIRSWHREGRLRAGQCFLHTLTWN